jgi:H+/gluconate symporter-like permease
MIAEAWRISIGNILATKYLKLNAFFSLLITAAVYRLVAGMNFDEIPSVIQAGFGTLLSDEDALTSFTWLTILQGITVLLTAILFSFVS